MRIIRSTLAETDIFLKIQDNYKGFLEGYSCTFEYRGLNDIFRIARGNQSLFFKIYARKDINQEDIEAEIEIVNYLNRSGLSVSSAVVMKNGKYLMPIELPEGTRFGVLFTEAQGVPCDSDTQDEQTITDISRLISDMHTHLDSIPFSPKRWTLDDHLFLDRSIEILDIFNQTYPNVDVLFLKEVVNELKTQIRAASKKWNWGFCHGDIYAGNIHRQSNGILTIYDFDFCGYGWRAYDVSPFLGNFSSGVKQDAIDRRKRRLEFFLKGYTHAGGFSGSEIEAIFKIFVPFRRIFNMGYLYEAFHYVWGNKLRKELIAHDTKLLREWIEYYW